MDNSYNWIVFCHLSESSPLSLLIPVLSIGGIKIWSWVIL